MVGSENLIVYEQVYEFVTSKVKSGDFDAVLIAATALLPRETGQTSWRRTRMASTVSSPDSSRIPDRAIDAVEEATAQPLLKLMNREKHGSRRLAD